MLHYDIANALLPYSERPYYVEVSCKDDEGHEVSIITNKDLCGKWWYDERRGTYQQTHGTCQYRLPSSASGIRKRLRKEMESLLD